MNDFPDVPQSPGTKVNPRSKKKVRFTTANTVRGVKTANQHAYGLVIFVSLASGAQRQLIKDHYTTHEDNEFDILCKTDGHTYRCIWDNEPADVRRGPDNWDMTATMSGTRIS